MKLVNIQYMKLVNIQYMKSVNIQNMKLLIQNMKFVNTNYEIG